jgi:2-succinyl-6-hydroxy-2,4-cyclohexadiene-1-carboxylate synthase
VTRVARSYRGASASGGGATSLCVHEWGGDAAGASPPLVLLHGFTGCGLAWSQAAAVLSAPARILAPDLPGHGESAPRGGESAGTSDRGDARDAERCTFDAAASALDAALDAAGVTSFDLHGYSMGGRFALYFALTRPSRVRRLCVESASAGLASAGERESRMRSDEQLARLALEDGIERFVDRWERTPVLAAQLSLPAEDRARVRTLRLRNSVEGLAASLRGMGTGAQPYLGDRLAELSMPVLVMAGEDDAKFSSIARELAGCIGDARVALIPGAGHTPHLEQPRLWAAALDSFIAETERGESCRSSGRP